MQKLWLASYPAGIPATIDAGRFASAVELFDDSVKRFADHTACIFEGRRLSYHELDRLAAAFAGWLQREAELVPGERVAIMLPNCLQHPVCVFGALRAGAVVVGCNPRDSGAELRHRLSDSDARVLVVLDEFAHRVGEALGGTQVTRVVVSGLTDLLPAARRWQHGLASLSRVGLRVLNGRTSIVRFRDAISRGDRRPPKKLAREPDNLAFLQYTSGTTGVSKAAMLTHRNLVANLEQIRAWLKPVFHEGEELFVSALPLNHIFSLSASCLGFMRLGATSLLIPDPDDTPAFVRELATHRVTAITGTSGLFAALLANEAFHDLEWSALKCCFSSGLSLQKMVALRWKAATGKSIVTAYGLAETTLAVTMNPLGQREFNPTIGLPLPSTEVSIRDDFGRELAPGEIGELCLRGPQVMRGYWKLPVETANALTPDGFLRTGDIASIDRRGFVSIVDRKSDRIIVSGFKVYPHEVEDIVARHPGVIEVAAVGVPDRRSGEAVKLFVVRRSPTLTGESLLAHCAAHLTGACLPASIEFRDELPKTRLGAILRRTLRDEERTRFNV
jgi:long-chain acyl-CoA synthetase